MILSTWHQPFALDQALFPTKTGGLVEPPASCRWAMPSLDGRNARVDRYFPSNRLRGLDWAFGFESFLDATDIHFDLLRFGFRLLGQLNIQHALVIVGGDVLRIYGIG